MLELHVSQAGYRAVLAWETLVNLNPGWQEYKCEKKQRVLLKAPQDHIQPLQWSNEAAMEPLFQDSCGDHSYRTLSHLCVAKAYWKVGACLLLSLEGDQ